MSVSVRGNNWLDWQRGRVQSRFVKNSEDGKKKKTGKVFQLLDKHAARFFFVLVHSVWNVSTWSKNWRCLWGILLKYLSMLYPKVLLNVWAPLFVGLSPLIVITYPHKCFSTSSLNIFFSYLFKFNFVKRTECLKCRILYTIFKLPVMIFLGWMLVFCL